MARAKNASTPKKKVQEQRAQQSAVTQDNDSPKRAVSVVEVGEFTRGFADLVGEGTSLVRSLATLEEQQSNPLFKRVIGEINQKIQQGHTLSRTLAEYPDVFDAAYISTIRLGEVNGTLDQMLYGLSHVDDVVSFDDAVKFLGTSKPTLYRLLKQGDIKGLKVGRQWRFFKTDLVAHLERKPSSIASAPLRELESEIAHLAGELQKLGLEPPALEGTKSPQADEAASPDEQKVVQLVNSILKIALHFGASDIHINPQSDGVLLRLREDGVLREVHRLPWSLLQPVVDRLKVMADCNVAERRVPQNGRIHLHHQGQDFAVPVAICPSAYGESVVLRVLAQPQALVTLEHLDMEPDHLAQMRAWLHRPHGLILVTGPPLASGKTSVLYSCLHEINAPEKKIVTVEDPVERKVSGVVQVHVNHKAGLTFPVALRAFLGQDADIIMVGEIRDLETAELASQAGLLGHAVLAGFSANSAVDAALRLRDMGVESFTLSGALIGLSAQRLARRLCENCREESGEALPSALQNMARASGFALSKETIWHRARGCEQCRETGYRGRIALYEMVTWNAALSEALVRGASREELTRIAVESGHRMLLADGLGKAARGETSVEEVLRVLGIFL